MCKEAVVSSGSAPVDLLARSRSKERDVVMDSADVEIPLADGAQCVVIFVKVSDRYGWKQRR